MGKRDLTTGTGSLDLPARGADNASIEFDACGRATIKVVGLHALRRIEGTPERSEDSRFAGRSTNHSEYQEMRGSIGRSA